MGRQLHLLDDHMSGNWSLGSKYHPCSQSRKISIGIVVDSVAKTKGKNGRGDVTELQTLQNVTSAKDTPTERQNKAPCQEPPPLVYTNTSHQNISHPDTINHPKKVSSLPSTSNVLLQPNKIVGETDPDTVFETQMSDLHSKDANNEEKLKKNTYQSEAGSHFVMGREEQSSYATPQKVTVPEKGITEQGTSERGNNGNMALRMKVQELLGTVYSPNKKQHDHETFGMDANNSKPKSVTNKSDSQHLQTRETHSGSLNKRPVTRSFTSKKPQTQKSVPLYQYKEAQLDKNVFSFVDNWSKNASTNVNHGSTMSKRKERGVHKDENHQATDVRKRKADTVNVSLKENRRGDIEKVQPDTEMKDQFEVIRTGGGNNSTMLKNNKDQDSSSKHSLKINLDPQYDLKSPPFEFKTAPRSLFYNNHEDLDVGSLSKRSFKSHSIGFSMGAHSNANTNNFTMDPQDCVAKPATVHKESKYVGSEISEDGSPVTVPVTLENKNINGNRWSISPSCQEEVSESSEDGSPIKGDGDCEKFHDTSLEQDGLAGAVKLFALALERVESKIHSSTTRQSAEILLSVSMNIHLQLQNAESKIQNEVGKLTNLGKSKRMHSESQCQEQQEQLKRIYEKFKEEVDQHLEKCRSTLKGLESHEIDVRGMVEKQRLSHRKLLMQTEEAIEAQLNDAQKRLSDVHRVAREKMVKLKYGIAECLKEGLHGS
ncbi:meiosis-specific protein ASY3 isoform X1 [Lactuca sativa]|uniref:Meiosis-specific protein ASY3-like coiled-coil domain-containing protein n=1 Tax=Lactuca sativa TaxID=4236 RepID=A0A9R1UID5_LACSA|nr:meiosis-specific protein ASY3 isoform X1 [Lactuca sativa]XP_042754270.1 meiosis-specific protein ASY3 isoform X1 [Lactuca sativa]KAJ0187677.1 hypothetical protein LSAT_V11C900454980 [Lactuca sativa]